MMQRRSAQRLFKDFQLLAALKNKATGTLRPASSIEQRVSSIKHRASSIECQASSIAYRSSSIEYRVSSIIRRALICLIFIFTLSTTHAAATEQDAFKETVYRLSSLADRSTGTDGNQAAAAYIKERFEQLGFETVGTQKFAVPVI